MGFKSEWEEKALAVLLRHLKANGRGNWQKESRPDESDRDQPAPDFLISRQETAEQVAVEVTTFDWPPDATTIKAAMSRACREVECRAVQVEGTFALSVDLLDIRRREVFSRALRESTVQGLTELLRINGAALRLGEVRDFKEPFPLSLRRVADDGQTKVGWVALISNDIFEELDELERVLRDNARKFERLNDIPRWMVVLYLGTEARLELLAPSLRLPSEIDELYFIVYERSCPRLIDFRDVTSSVSGVMLDRENRAVYAVLATGE